MTNEPQPEKQETIELNNYPADQGTLVELFRLLRRNPPADHDFATCEKCKKYGITEL